MAQFSAVKVGEGRGKGAVEGVCGSGKEVIDSVLGFLGVFLERLFVFCACAKKVLVEFFD